MVRNQFKIKKILYLFVQNFHWFWSALRSDSTLHIVPFYVNAAERERNTIS